MSENIKYGFVGKNGKVYNNQNSEDLNDWYEQCLVQTWYDQVLKTKVGTFGIKLKWNVYGLKKV